MQLMATNVTSLIVLCLPNCLARKLFTIIKNKLSLLVYPVETRNRKLDTNARHQPNAA